MPNADTNKNILALRPGRREMGVAVLEGRELLFWGVAGFRGSRPKLLETVERRLVDLIQTYEPVALVIEQPTPARLAASPMLGAVMSQIRAVARREGLRVCLYDAETVREQLCGSAPATHNQLVERIVALYPHLERYRLHRRQPPYAKASGGKKEDYWRPMFAAVAVGVVCGQDGIKKAYAVRQIRPGTGSGCSDRSPAS